MIRAKTIDLPVGSSDEDGITFQVFAPGASKPFEVPVTFRSKRDEIEAINQGRIVLKKMFTWLAESLQPSEERA